MIYSTRLLFRRSVISFISRRQRDATFVEMCDKIEVAAAEYDIPSDKNDGVELTDESVYRRYIGVQDVGNHLHT